MLCQHHKPKQRQDTQKLWPGLTNNPHGSCRLIQVVIMSLIIGSLFAGIQKTATGSRAIFGVSFLSIMFLAMGAMPQLATTFMNKG